jgi:hypothetical protein
MSHDFAELYKKYANDQTSHPSDLIRWLEREGFTRPIIEATLVEIQEQLIAGKEFVGDNRRTAAWYLWVAARNIARELRNNKSDEILQAIAWRKLSKWQKIKRVLFGEI